MELSRRSAVIKASPIRKLAAMLEQAAAKHDMISFGGGAPSLAPPKAMLDHLAREMRTKAHRTASYGSTGGMPHVLELIAGLLKKEEKVKADPETEIMLTEGGTEGLFLALSAIVNPGDEVIISDPTYLGYPEPIKLLGGTPVSVPVHWGDDFQLTREKVERHISGRTKAVLMLSPDNPTGRVLDDRNIKGIVRLCAERGIWLITDDIYKDLIYEGSFTNSRAFGGYANTLTCCSFSKSASIPGFRIGYAYGSAELINKMNELKQYVTLCPSRPAQVCLEKFLENGAAMKRQYIRKTVMPVYSARRKKMAECLAECMPEANFGMPKGAFYFFPEISAYLKRLGLNDVGFCDMLVKKKGVVAIPGSYFGQGGRNNVRLTFVSEPEERMEEGFRRIAAMLR